MERAGDCSRHCRETARQFEEWDRGRRRGPKPRPINCANLEPAEGRIVKVTLGPTKPPHTVGSGTRWPSGLTHAQGPVHFICIGMFKRGVFTPRQAELTLRNLDNHPTLQGNLYQLGSRGPKPRPINCANLEPAEGRIVKVTLGPTKPPHTVGSGTRWPSGLTHAQGPVHFICIGMFKRGVFTPTTS